MPTKRVLVIRIGAYGDMIFITPALKQLKKDGYHVTLYSKQHESQVIKYNPNVDKLIWHDNKLTLDETRKVWNKISTEYDTVINFTGSLEENLLITKDQVQYLWSREKRHGYCNINYYDHTMKCAGYDIQGTNGELFFSPEETREARRFRMKYRDRFIIMCSLSGSSPHKSWPYFAYLSNAMAKYAPEALMLTLGDGVCKIAEWQAPNTKNYSGMRSMRWSLNLARFADLVIGPETGFMVGCGTMDDLMKIILLSHSSQENLTKYWKNTAPLMAYVDCQPCHKLIVSRDECPRDAALNHPVCMSNLHSKQVFNEVMRVYGEWKQGKAA